MSATSDFYFARAAACSAEADAAKLDNVRDRCLRAASAWLLMADKIVQTEEARATRDADKERTRQIVIDEAEGLVD
jgi:hypothetical protein